LGFSKNGKLKKIGFDFFKNISIKKKPLISSFLRIFRIKEPLVLVLSKAFKQLMVFKK
jgi:hypothetical protein